MNFESLFITEKEPFKGKILCLESITNDLLNWDDSNYQNFIKDRMTWAEELFNGLTNRVAKEE